MAKNIEIGERPDGSSNIEVCFMRAPSRCSPPGRRISSQRGSQIKDLIIKSSQIRDFRIKL